VKLLQDVLPFDEPLEPVTIRNHVFTLAERLEDELGDEQVSCIEGCPRDWGELPTPDGPLTVGIDGGYVKAQGAEHGWFEVIAGKSILSFRRGEEQPNPSVPHSTDWRAAAGDCAFSTGSTSLAKSFRPRSATS
jgi:hypothetical protein